MAFILSSAVAANAYRTGMIQKSVDQYWELQIGDTAEITVMFDSEGEANIALLSVGVLFNDSVFTYLGVSSPTYALYSPPGKGAIYLVPAISNGQLRVGTTDQVNLDWISSSLPDGNRGPGSFTLGILTFQFHDLGYDSAFFALSTNSPENTLQLGDGSNPEHRFWPIPESATAFLLGLSSARRRLG